MKRKLYLIVIMLCLVTLIAACGGGGGSSASNPPAKATKAIVKLSSAGTGAIYGIDVTVNLPSGVTVKSANPPQVDADAVIASGVTGTATIAAAVYTAATGTLPGKVRILMASSNGFTTGEFCTINSDIVSGATPTSGDFSIANFSALDENTDVINGLTAQIAVGLQ